MFVLGHIGLTSAAMRKADRRMDLAWASLLALLPDLIDKPLRVLAPRLVHHNTRSVGHSAAGALAVLAVLLVFRKKVGRPWLLWACYLGHLALDLIWTNPTIALWPILGPFPRPVYGDYSPTVLAYNLIGEIAGAAALIWLIRKGRWRPS